MDAVQQAVDRELRADHRLQSSQPDDFNIRNNTDIIRNNTDITSRVSGVGSTLTLLLAGVAAVSLWSVGLAS